MKPSFAEILQGQQPPPELSAYEDTPADKARAMFRAVGFDPEMASRVVSEATPVAQATEPGFAYTLAHALGQGVKGAYDWWNSPGNDKPITDPPQQTQEAFFAANRKPTLSKEELLKQELEGARASDNYKEAGPKNRLKLEAEASRRADARYDAQGQFAGDEDKRLGDEWQQIVQGRKAESDRQAMLPWYERHPNIANAAMYGGGLASAAFGRMGFNKIADEGNQLLAAVTKARASGNIGDEAQALMALESWKRRMPVEYTKVGVKTAGIPLEMRGAGNVGDAMMGPDIRDEQGNPDPRSARQQARNWLTDAFTTEEGAKRELLPSLATGGTMTMLGALLSRKPQMGPINSNLSYLASANRASDGASAGALTRAMPSYSSMLRGTSPDEVAIPLGDARAKMLAAQRGLDAERARPPISLEAEAPQAIEEAPTSAPPVPAITAGSQSGPDLPRLTSDKPNLAQVLQGKAASSGSSQTKPVIGGSHPDHNWNVKAGRWQDPNNGNQFLPGPPPKNAE